MSDLLTTYQVQELLRVDRTTIYRMVEDGRLPALRIGKQWRFDRGAIERWLAGRAAAPAAPGSEAAPRLGQPAMSGPVRLADILPLACVQLIQDAFADMLELMMVVTDMRGQLVTQPSNPCRYFSVATRNAGGAAACTRTWLQLAANAALEPRFYPSELGLLCTRGLIRLGSELVGMVVLGGIAPELWPPSDEQLAEIAQALQADTAALRAAAADVCQLDRAAQERALRFAQRIADIFSHIAADRGSMVGRLQAIASLTSLG